MVNPGDYEQISRSAKLFKSKYGLYEAVLIGIH